MRDHGGEYRLLPSAVSVQFSRGEGPHTHDLGHIPLEEVGGIASLRGGIQKGIRISPL
jgi:hypothetical protein